MSIVRPDLGSVGRELFYQVGVGLAFLSTVRSDGGPRLNPMCPILTDDRIFALIVPGPKCADLERAADSHHRSRRPEAHAHHLARAGCVGVTRRLRGPRTLVLVRNRSFHRGLNAEHTSSGARLGSRMTKFVP